MEGESRRGGLGGHGHWAGSWGERTRALAGKQLGGGNIRVIVSWKLLLHTVTLQASKPASREGSQADVQISVLCWTQESTIIHVSTHSSWDGVDRWVDRWVGVDGSIQNPLPFHPTPTTSQNRNSSLTGRFGWQSFWHPRRCYSTLPGQLVRWSEFVCTCGGGGGGGGTGLGPRMSTSPASHRIGRMRHDAHIALP